MRLDSRSVVGRLTVGLVLAAALGGCAQQTAPAHMVRPADLQGRTFASTSVRVFPAKPGIEVAMKFSVGDQLVATTGCHATSGRYHLLNDHLTVPGGTTVAIRCSGNEQDDWLGNVLRQGVDVQLSGETLTLTRKTTEIVLQESGQNLAAGTGTPRPIGG